MAIVRILMPAWAYNSNSPYSATYTDTTNASRYYPSYSYMNMNSYINRDNNPAFVANAMTGTCGQGISFYGYMNSYVSAEYQKWKDVTHVWSMAIPETMGAPIGLFTIGVYAGINTPPNYDTMGPYTSYNMALYIDTDRILKAGVMTGGSSLPPTLIHNYGVDMTPYMYNSAVRNTDAYVGHRYAVVYNVDIDSYDLYVDNSNTLIASLNNNSIVQGALVMMNNATYNDWFNNGGGSFNNYWISGPGVYMYNWSTDYNIIHQGNVYFSDWAGWETSFNLRDLNAIMNFNYKIKKAPKTSSSNGAFYYCNNLRSIVLPGSMHNIPQATISGQNLNSVTFRNGVRNISYRAIVADAITVNIPKSADCISSDAIVGYPVTLSPISYNLMMRHNMFGNIPTDYDYERYEHLEELSIDNMPIKQAKPNQWYNPLNNYVYNTPRYITPITNQAEINSGGDELIITWRNLNAQLIFNESVNRAVHSNALGYQPHSMDDDGYVLDMHSLEFPAMSVSMRCNFINDNNFILTPYPLYGQVIGHITGNFVQIPSIFDDVCISRNINFNVAGYNNGPTHLLIEVPKKSSDEINYPTSTDVWRLPVDTTSVHIHDGHAITLHENTANNIDYSISNVNYIQFLGLRTEPVQLNECYGAFGMIPIGTTVRSVCDNFITVSGNYSNEDLSDAPLHFRYWRQRKYNDLNDASVLNDDNYISHTTHDAFGDIFTDAYFNDVQLNDIQYIGRYLVTATEVVYAGETAMFMNAMRVNNSILPSSITISNLFGQCGQFSDCTGDIDVTINGYITAVNSNINVRMFENHIGTLNFDINVRRIPSTNSAYHGNGATPLYIANNCDIDTIKLEYSDDYPSSSNMGMLLNDGSYKFAVIATNSNINKVVIDKPYTMYCFRNCNINNIEYSGVPMRQIELANCNIYCSIQDVFNNVEKMPNCPGTNFFGDSDLTVHIKEVDVLGATNRLSNIYISNSLTIIDTTGLTSHKPEFNYVSVPHVNCVGRISPSFMNSDIQTAHIECTELGKFSNTYSLESITGLENCLFIGDNTFRGVNSISDITVHPNCSIHSKAFYGTSQVPNIHYGNGSKYPVDLNIDYMTKFINPASNTLITADSRLYAAPRNWGSIHNRIKVNIVFNDGSEEPTDDYIVYPDFPCANGYANDSLYHTVYANGAHKRIKAPYNACTSSYNTVAQLRTRENYSVTYIGQSFDIKNDCGGYALLNCDPYSATASSSNWMVKNWTSLNSAHTVMFTGNYSRYTDAEYITMSRNIIAMNTERRNGVTNILGYSVDYLRDDCVYAYTWAASGIGNNNSKYAGNIHTLDFHLSTKSLAAIGNNMINGCNVRELFLCAGPSSGYIANNAVNNAQYLYWVDMSLMNYKGFQIYDDAFINCPALQHLYIPAGTTRVGNGAFNRTGLKHVEVPTGCALGTNAFPADCTITYY